MVVVDMSSLASSNLGAVRDAYALLRAAFAHLHLGWRAARLRWQEERLLAMSDPAIRRELDVIRTALGEDGIYNSR